ncbi:MAG TPA: hypothetical protein VJ276_14690 [Thermoanaerobaculia bacterium]|nr:hypothetical protein [Thermoanaerobaculia bacterium]
MRIVALVFCAFVVLPLMAAQTAPAPSIAFDGNGITVSGLTPGGNAALFMMSRRPDVFMTRMEQRADVLAAGADGKVRFDTENGVVPTSVWAVIDVESGQYAVACPSGDCAPLQRTLNTAAFFKNNAAGEPEGLDIPLAMADVFLVRAKSGVWHVMLGDGGAGDEDGILNGKARVSVEKFAAMRDKTPPPSKLKKGDLLFLFQPMNLHFAIVEVTK